MVTSLDAPLNGVPGIHQERDVGVEQGRLSGAGCAGEGG